MSTYHSAPFLGVTMGCGDTVRSPAVSLFFPIYSYLSWYGKRKNKETILSPS